MQASHRLNESGRPLFPCRGMRQPDASVFCPDFFLSEVSSFSAGSGLTRPWFLVASLSNIVVHYNSCWTLWRVPLTLPR